MEEKTKPDPAKPAKRRGKPANGAAQARSGATGSSYAVPALDKALDVLELMSNLSDPITPSQIAQRLGRSLQEVYRVVLVLEGRGYLMRPPGTDALVLSTQLFGLATRFPPFRRVVDVAQPIINSLAINSGEAVHIAVLDGLRMCIIAQVDSPQPIGVRLRVGVHSPAILGSSGRLLIAFQTEPVRKWYLEQAAASLPPDDVAHARSRVEAIDRHGFELANAPLLPGIVDISFPILDQTGVALAAVTIPYMGSYGTPKPRDVVVRLLHEAADQISTAMGGRLRPLADPLPEPGPRSLGV
jgi:DNA-binding IclR family transcriptional regulator